MNCDNKMKAILKSLILIYFSLSQIVYAELIEEPIDFQPDFTYFEDLIKITKKLNHSIDNALDGEIDSLGADIQRKKKLLEFNEIYDDFIEKKKKYYALSPEYRTIKEINFDKTAIFSAFGYEMQLPWEMDARKQDLDCCSYILKPNDWLILIENPRDSIGSSIFYKFRSISGFDFLFYDIPSNNQFEFIKSILSVKPADLKRVHDQNQIYWKKSQIIVASLLKPLYIRELHEQDIYYFSLSNVKGFQIGNPEKGNQTKLVLYPNDNEEIHIIVYSGNNKHITQDHIDYIIQNFKSDSSKE